MESRSQIITRGVFLLSSWVIAVGLREPLRVVDRVDNASDPYSVPGPPPHQKRLNPFRPLPYARAVLLVRYKR
ncbi:hypothetical protein L873DRAFT_1812033 [Choiromyces venosus 120613-1]|uniref:Uncharacterized protein n=1 Tax=Choiromyces venosus 120613-1 TaxID=1336337 RepID=A0A3N4JCI2_9PEZI|nr:hypothetical protein L873DRAFT_1812033 [Choiromyces venosus 120613-1]